MSYEVQFRGRDVPSILIDNDKGAKLWEMWFGGNQKNTPVDAGNNTAFLIGDIKRIQQVPDPKIEIPNFDQTALPEGKKCRAEFSIQREINQIIKSEYPKDWAKRIGDKLFREKLRKQLHEQPGVMWCDDRTGDCACA